MSWKKSLKRGRFVPFDSYLKYSSLHGFFSINLAKFLPDTMYNLTYEMYLGGENVKDRKKGRGKIHVRLRIECHNARKVVFKGLVPPPESYMAVSRKVDWEVAHYTIEGGTTRDTAFSMPRFLR